MERPSRCSPDLRKESCKADTTGSERFRERLCATAARRLRRVSSNGSRIAFNLRAVQNAARIGREGVTPVHGAAVIPQHHVTHSPLNAPSESLASGVGPQFIQKGFGFV